MPLSDPFFIFEFKNKRSPYFCPSSTHSGNIDLSHPAPEDAVRCVEQAKDNKINNLLLTQHNEQTHYAKNGVSQPRIIRRPNCEHSEIGSVRNTRTVNVGARQERLAYESPLSHSSTAGVELLVVDLIIVSLCQETGLVLSSTTIKMQARDSRIVDHVNSVYNRNITAGNAVNHNVSDFQGMEAVIDDQDIATSVFRQHRTSIP